MSRKGDRVTDPLFVQIAGGGAGSGGTSSTDGAPYAPSASAGTPVIGAVDEVTPSLAAEGALAIIRATTARALHVNLRDAAGDELALATEATLAGILAAVDGLEALAASIDERLGSPAQSGEAALATAGLATAAKQDAAKTVLDSIAAKDFATAAKQDAAKTVLDAISGKDFATAAKQDAAKTVLDSIAAKDFATAAKQDALKTEVEKGLATSIKRYALDLGSARTASDITGSDINICWVMVLYYDGANSDRSATPTQALRLGTAGSDPIDLFTLTAPDSVVIFEGYISGRIYLTNAAESGKKLILIVGVR